MNLFCTLHDMLMFLFFFLLLLDRLHQRGGEMCAYVRKLLKINVLKELSYTSEQNFHQLWLSAQFKKLKLMMICITYRSNDSPLMISSFEEVLN